MSPDLRAFFTDEQPKEDRKKEDSQAEGSRREGSQGKVWRKTQKIVQKEGAGLDWSNLAADAVGYRCISGPFVALGCLFESPGDQRVRRPQVGLAEPGLRSGTGGLPGPAAFR